MPTVKKPLLGALRSSIGLAGGVEGRRSWKCCFALRTTAQQADNALSKWLYRELLALVKDKSVVLEEYATRLVSAEAVHLREMELMAMRSAPD
jgi:hypothetical protein